MKVKKSLIVWCAWIIAVLCFAFAGNLAPEPTHGPSSMPEFFLLLLGLIHLVGGVFLIGCAFDDEN